MAIGVVFLLALALACGGGKDDSDPIDADEAKQATDRYLATSLRLFTGQVPPQEFIEAYAPECREGVDAQDIALAMLFIQAFAPGLQGVNVEGVDVGNVTVEHTEEGTLVSPEAADALRVTVDGESISAAEFFAGVGLEQTGEDDLVEPLLLVRRDGDIYLGDCSELSGLSGGLDTSSVPRATRPVIAL